ncbi:44016_t:CDS:1, partial [Gigaspora margarita]
YFTAVSSKAPGCYCSGVFHIHVTDCNGNVLFDTGLKDCDFKKVIFSWYEAPSLYCVHVYPQLYPDRNRYQEVYNRDSCFGLCGDELSWSFDPQNMTYCQ